MRADAKQAGQGTGAMARRYVEEALRRIDRVGGLHDLTLRDLARTLGCAHTNAYNYFSDLPDLRWQVRAAALDAQLRCSLEALEAAHGPRGFDAVVGAQVAFALQHPGWFRAIWLDALDGEPPKPMLDLLGQASAALLRTVALVAPASLSRARLLEVAEHAHTYLHGALCKAVAGRVGSHDPAALRWAIVGSTRRIVELLARELARRATAAGAKASTLTR